MKNRHVRAFALAASAGLAVGFAPSRGAAQGTKAGTTVTLLGYQTTVPADWTSRAPSSTMRLAEYTVAPKDGAGAAEVVVYFFGPGQGGGVEANVERWRGQFSEPDGGTVPELVTRDTSAGFPITFADFRGTYRRGFGAGSADSVRAGQELLAAIAETPRGTLFVQLFGPIARVSAERPAFLQFVKGLR
jgi:hypothetical protein